MNLTDLRAELDSRATEADDHLSDLVPGTRRKIRQTKRRRIAGALGGTAVVALLAAGLLVPSLTSTTTPDPADPPPADYIKDGVKFHGIVNETDRLEKAWIGKPGEGPLDFTWTPTTNNVVLRSFCRSTSSTPKSLRVWINTRLVSDFDCMSDTNTSGEAAQPLTPNAPVWIDAPIGKPARVKVAIVDQVSHREGDSSAQLGLGIYNSPVKSVDEGGIPTRIAPTSPDDYSKDGIRYRAKVGGDKLAAAVVGDTGQDSVHLTFRPTGTPVVLRSFCTANNNGVYDSPPTGLWISIRIGNQPERRSTCFAHSTDAGAEGGSAIPMPASTEPVQATATVVDSNGRPVSAKDARIAFGVYYQGAQRLVTAPDGNQVSLDEVTEANGYTYKLADLKTADAATARRLAISIPTGKPFVFATGSTALGDPKLVSAKVTGLDTDYYLATDPDTPGSPDDFGLNLTAMPPGQTDTATLEVEKGHPTKGKFILAVYLPE
jgi:hypothetical protein